MKEGVTKPPSSSFKRQVKCPSCGKETVFSPENPHRPFCSERCRTIDLGQWASEDYKIPSQEKASVQDLPDPSSSEDFDS